MVEPTAQGLHNATSLAKRMRRPRHNRGRRLQPFLSPPPHLGLGVQRLLLQTTAAVTEPMTRGLCNTAVLAKRKERFRHISGRRLQPVSLPPSHLGQGVQSPFQRTTAALTQPMAQGLHSAVLLAKRRRHPCHSCGKHLQPVLSPLPHLGLGVQRPLQRTAAAVTEPMTLGLCNTALLAKRKRRLCHIRGRRPQPFLSPLLHLGLGV